jgi:uncharacterized protein YecE (DUF72 family)
VSDGGQNLQLCVSVRPAVFGNRTEKRILPLIHIGCSGWVYPHWRGLFYPEKLAVKNWFAFYAEHFDTVEINNSFYRLPKASTFETWRVQAPANFRYAVKANRYLTQAKS